MKNVVFLTVFLLLALCSCRNGKAVAGQSDPITAEMAFEGVSRYCHGAYDWSVAADNPSIMSVQMGEPTDSAFHVVFRSYTGAFVHFYVNKSTGSTRMVEQVPALDVEADAGTINLFDYLQK